MAKKFVTVILDGRENYFYPKGGKLAVFVNEALVTEFNIDDYASEFNEPRVEGSAVVAVKKGSKNKLRWTKVGQYWINADYGVNTVTWDDLCVFEDLTHPEEEDDEDFEQVEIDLRIGTVIKAPCPQSGMAEMVCILDSPDVEFFCTRCEEKFRYDEVLRAGRRFNAVWEVLHEGYAPES